MDFVFHSYLFFGYLFGSLITILPIFKNRVKLFFLTAVIISLLTTLLMAFNNDIIIFIVIRFLAGVSSAFVLIFGTALILPSIQAFGKKSLSTSHFMGVGFGIVFSSILISLKYCNIDRFILQKSR